jgi:heat shock protein HslJ
MQFGASKKRPGIELQKHGGLFWEPFAGPERLRAILTFLFRWENEQMHRMKAVASGLGILALVLAACAVQRPGSGTAQPGTHTTETRSTGETVEPQDAGARKADEPIDLDESEWVLISLNGHSLVPDSNITLGFAEGRAGGFAGCNGYGGEYAAADQGALSIPEIAVQLQLCDKPEGVIEQESAYLEALQSATAYQVTGDRLKIEDALGQTILIFTIKEELPMDPDHLLGTRWQLLSVNGVSPHEGSAITIVFEQGNKISGQAGCRGYVGVYQASGDDIRFPMLAMIGPSEPCSEALLVQEGEYTTRLELATDYRLSAGQLELFTARGETLLFEPLPEDAYASLERTTWELIAFIQEKRVGETDTLALVPLDVLVGTEITAEFEGGTLSGSAGCNTYGAAYTVDGPSLNIETPAATEMACGDPAHIMRQEQRYLNHLANVTLHRIHGNQLQLETGDGWALVFAARGVRTTTPTDAPTSPLAGAVDAHSVELVSQWGGQITTAAIRGSHAYLGVGLKLMVLDISDPRLPTLTGELLLPSQATAIHGWGDYAYVGAGHSLHIINIKDPTAPTIAGSYRLPGSVTDVTMTDARLGSDPVYAYVAYSDTFETGGLLVLDLSNPAYPSPLGSQQTGGQPSVTLVPNSERLYAYLAERHTCQRAASLGVECSGSLRILDVSDPTAPAEIAFYELPTWAREVAVRDGHAYVAQAHCDMDRGCDGGLQILDVSNPNAPRELGQYDQPIWSIELVGDYLYADDLHILDIADPANPVEIAAGKWGSVLETVVDDYAYIVQTIHTPGLRIVDVSNPVAPAEISFYSPPGLVDVRNITVSSDYAYLIDQSKGLQVIDISNPAEPTPLGLYAQPALGNIWGQHDQYLYLGDERGGVRVVDVSDPLAPSELGSYAPPEGQRILAVLDDHAYVTAGAGVQIIDLLNAAGPEEVGFYKSTSLGNILDVSLADGHAYVGKYQEGVQVVDLSDPAAPIELGFFRMAYDPTMLAADGYVYYNAGGRGLQVVGLSNPAKPVELGFYETPGHDMQKITALRDSYAYLLVGGKLRIVDVSDPAAPAEVGLYDAAEYIREVAVADGPSADGSTRSQGVYAYLLAGPNGLRILDVSNPSQPVEIGAYIHSDAGLPAHKITIIGNYAYLYDHYSGAEVWVIDISNPTAPTQAGFLNLQGQIRAIVSRPASDTTTASAEALAYVLDLERNLRVIDLSDLAAPVERGFYDLPEQFGRVSVANDMLYVGTEQRLLVLDVSDPSTPTQVGFYQARGLQGDAFVADGHAYLPMGQFVLQILDLTNPSAPTEAGLFLDLHPGSIQQVKVAEGRVYLLIQRPGDAKTGTLWGIQVVDVSSPTNPAGVGLYQPKDPGLNRLETVANGRVYFIDQQGVLRIVDLSDPATPVELASYDPAGRVGSIAVVGDYIYAAALERGLVILRVTPRP